MRDLDLDREDIDCGYSDIQLKALKKIRKMSSDGVKIIKHKGNDYKISLFNESKGYIVVRGCKNDLRLVFDVKNHSDAILSMGVVK